MLDAALGKPAGAGGDRVADLERRVGASSRSTSPPAALQSALLGPANMARWLPAVTIASTG